MPCTASGVGGFYDAQPRGFDLSTSLVKECVEAHWTRVGPCHLATQGIGRRGGPRDPGG